MFESPAFLLEVSSLSAVVEEIVCGSTEFSLWENGLREINSRI